MLRIRKSHNLPKVMQLGKKVTALAQVSDPALYLKEGCPHFLTLLGLCEGTLSLMVWRR